MYDLETTMFVARFNNNGLPDSSFGTDGVTTYNQGDFSTVKDLIVLPDNKILFGVQVVYDAVPQINIPTILKYLPNGTPDASFGINGVVSNVTGYGRMRVQNNGKIILTTTNQGKIQLSRRNADGNLDLTFGNNGFALIKYPYAKDNFFPGILAIQADNKIIMAGRADINIPSTSYTFCVRTNADGTVDNSFGNTGFIRSPVNSPDTYISPRALIIQQDGKLVIGGELRSYGLPDPDSSFLAHFNTDGSPDASWGNNGYIKRPYARGYSIFGIALQSDGKIVTCGDQVKYDENGYFTEDHPSIGRFIGAGDELKNQVDNIAENKIKMYPNPVADILYLQPAADVNIVRVEIANSMGKILIAQQIKEHTQIIPVKIKSLQQGIYYIRSVDKTNKITSAILNKN